MSSKTKFFRAIVIFALLAMAFVPTASAFDGREGDEIIIGEDEVVEDDLYIGAEKVIVDGAVEGDLYAGAESITVNGVIEGDLVTGAQSVTLNGEVKGDVIAFAQSVLINGIVGDDLRAGAAAIQLEDDAKIGDDLLFGGASLEAKDGSQINGDLLVGGAQTLVAGDIAGDMLVGTSAFELSGTVNGDVKAYVDSHESDGDEGMPPMFFGPDMNISLPSVASGINLKESASIGGDMIYTSSTTFDFPAGVIGGAIERQEPVYDEIDHPAPPTPQALAGKWFLRLLRNIITLTTLGVLLGLLFPNFLASAEYKLQNEPLPSLGWGVLAYAAFYFALLVILTVMILGAVIFGVLSLGGLSGTIIALGLLLIFALLVGFILTVAYLTKIIVSLLGGKLILARVKPEWANHKVYPLLVGVILLSAIVAIPVVGWLVKLIVVLLGLGSLWLLGREQFARKKTTKLAEA